MPNFFSLLKLFHAKIFAQEAFSLGFPVMGFGIERRHKRLGLHWESHLKMTIESQKSWATSCVSLERDKGSLLVLGAGRLFDFDKTLKERFLEISLVDADPFCLPVWRNFKRSLARNVKFNFIIEDITGFLKPWQQYLQNATKNSPWQSTLSKLRGLSNNISVSNLSIQCQKLNPTAILSLNLLSQLPIAWQDIVERLLIKQFGAKFTRAHEHEWLEAIYPTAAFLVENHLKQLNSYNSDSILLITDIEYLHYKGELDYRSIAVTEAPFYFQSEIKDNAWIRNNNLKSAKDMHCEIIPALYGVALEDPKYLESIFSNYKTKLGETWLWHIAPQGFEDKKMGIIHRVRAIEFKKL